MVFSTLNYKSFSLCIRYYRLSHLGLKMRKQLTLILNIPETDKISEKIFHLISPHLVSYSCYWLLCRVSVFQQPSSRRSFPQALSVPQLYPAQLFQFSLLLLLGLLRLQCLQEFSACENSCLNITTKEVN